MARTKAEIRAFLDGQVGTIPQHPAPYNTGANNLSGQCVTGVKALLNFLGVPNPYGARGNAISVDDTLLAQGIAQSGKGWLTIVVNRDMGYIGGVHYGHIWINLQGEANYETNGARALYTTKNTRPISQGQQFVNLDKYITDGGNADMINSGDVAPVRIVMSEIEAWDMNDIHSGKDDGVIMGYWVGKSWVDFITQSWQGQPLHRGYLVQQINDLSAQVGALSSRPTAADLQAAKDAAAALQQSVTDAQKAAADSKAAYDKLAAQAAADQDTGNSFLRWLGNLLNGLKGK